MRSRLHRIRMARWKATQVCARQCIRRVQWRGRMPIICLSLLRTAGTNSLSVVRHDSARRSVVAVGWIYQVPFFFRLGGHFRFHIVAEGTLRSFGSGPRIHRKPGLTDLGCSGIVQIRNICVRQPVFQLYRWVWPPASEMALIQVPLRSGQGP